MNTPEQVSKNSCNCSSAPGSARWAAAGGVVASLGICAACCLLPMILIVLGVGGAWAGRLEALAPFKWYFVGATALLLGFGFYSVYFRSKQCSAGPQCKSCRSGRGVKVLLWAAAVLAVAGLLFEKQEPFFG